MANPRTKARIEARILERAAHCVEFELNDPRGSFITLTRVEISNDLSTAKVFYSVYGSEGDKSRARHMLDGASGFIRSQVGRVLRTRRIPRLTWIYDDSIEYAAEMQKKIAEALRHDREVNPAAHADKRLEEPEPDEDEELDREYIDYLNALEEEEGENEEGGEASRG
jgi:ribosome-binding factor A